MLSGDNMVDLKSLAICTLGNVAILAHSACAIANSLSDGFIHAWIYAAEELGVVPFREILALD